jgi:hypothetical protein
MLHFLNFTFKIVRLTLQVKMTDPLTPRGKGNGEGRPILKNAGPILMTPGGTFINLEESQNYFGYTRKNERSGPAAAPSSTLKLPPSAALPEGWENKQLFGGAISCAMPASFEDVSIVRQVPDHQEVFVHKDSEMSLIIELLQYDETIPDEKAGFHYFEDLCLCNEAQQSKIESSEIVNDPEFLPGVQNKKYTKCALVGRQIVAKFNSNNPNQPKDAVQILLMVLRLNDVGTDLLVTLNLPYAQQTARDSGASLLQKPIIVEHKVSPADIMKITLHTLRILDWSLFG